MTIYNTADNVNDIKKKGTNNDDFYYIDNEKVQIIEESNGGEDTVYSTLNYTLGNNIENLTLTTMLDAEKIASRLGFNPTTINKMINKQIKNAA